MASIISASLATHICYGFTFSNSCSRSLHTASCLSMTYRRRPRPLSSKGQKEHTKKVFRGHHLQDANFQKRSGRSTDSENLNLEGLSGFHPEEESIANIHTFSNAGNVHETDSHDFSRIYQNNDVDSRNNPSGIHLEELLKMIHNAEKNIILLNQARVRVLEDLNRMLSEKKNLQGQVDVLHKQLVKNDAEINASAQEKIDASTSRGHTHGLSRNHTTENWELDERSKFTEIALADIPMKQIEAYSSVHEELRALREENAFLRGDIQELSIKLAKFHETNERVMVLEKERSEFESSLSYVTSKLAQAEKDVSQLPALKLECNALWEKVKAFQELLQKIDSQADQTILVLQRNHELREKVDKLEESLAEAKSIGGRLQSELSQQVETFEDRLARSDKETHKYIRVYQESVEEFQSVLNSLKEELEESRKKWARDEPANDMPWEFWSSILLKVDGLFLEKKLLPNDANLLREMAWKRNSALRDACMVSKDRSEEELITKFLKLTSSYQSSGLHVVHIAAEMAPVAKVGGLADVVCGLAKALQRRGHLVEVILPKYDCMQYDHIHELKVLDFSLESYFDGQLFQNAIWTGMIEGIPVYFIEPHHPDRLFWRKCYYGEHDDFKRFSFFSRAALELLVQAGKKPDIIHCHDWQTALIAPLYWDMYAHRGFNSARICFTCHNFEYQGKAPPAALSSCGLEVQQLNRPDRMKDNNDHGSINALKGAVVFSNIVTTVSPTYAKEVQTPEGGRGIQETLKQHSRKFIGILNGIDTDTWDPSTDAYLQHHYCSDNIDGKRKNKDLIRKHLDLSASNLSQPLVSCITRLVHQKGVHLIRHAIYRTVELGGQFVLLGASPIPYIQREFEGIASAFKSNSNASLVLTYDEALAHSIYAASDIFIVPSLFEPCGLTQMVAMRYGAIPIVRKTGGLADSVLDVDDHMVPDELRNGFLFSEPNEQALDVALMRALNMYNQKPEIWKKLTKNVMSLNFSWESPAMQYEELYQKSVARARTTAPSTS